MTSVAGKNAKLIFRHHIESKSDLFTSSENYLSINTPNKYSIIGQIAKNKEYYKSNGYFEFILEYPELKGCNHWKQSIFPSEAEHGVENGFVDLGFSYPANSAHEWHGLSKGKSGSYLDGTPHEDNWHYPIGQPYLYCEHYALPSPLDTSCSTGHYLKDTSLYIVIPFERFIHKEFHCKSNYFSLVSIVMLIMIS